MGDFILKRFICKTYFEQAEKPVVMQLSVITETQIFYTLYKVWSKKLSFSGISGTQNGTQCQLCYYYCCQEPSI